VPSVCPRQRSKRYVVDSGGRSSLTRSGWPCSRRGPSRCFPNSQCGCDSPNRRCTVVGVTPTHPPTRSAIRANGHPGRKARPPHPSGQGNGTASRVATSFRLRIVPTVRRSIPDRSPNWYLAPAWSPSMNRLRPRRSVRSSVLRNRTTASSLGPSHSHGACAVSSPARSHHHTSFDESRRPPARLGHWSASAAAATTTPPTPCRQQTGSSHPP
jgi:hypothetical protein